MKILAAFIGIAALREVYRTVRCACNGHTWVRARPQGREYCSRCLGWKS